MQSNGKVPAVLLGVYLVFCALLAIHPVDQTTWFVENMTVWIIVGVIAALWFRGVRFSNLAYILMSVLIFMHTIGGHYTFEKVPFDWVTNFFEFSRNHYDRVAHFTVGFYAFALAEWLQAKRLVANRFLLLTYPVFVIATIAMSYEIIEWLYAANANAAAGAAYLGSQGDVWDAQKDMLMDTLGGITGVLIYFFVRRPSKDLSDKKETTLQ